MAHKEYIVSYNPTFKRAADLSPVYYFLHANGSYFLTCALEDYVFSCSISAPADISDFTTNYLPSATSLPSKDDTIAYAVINAAFYQTKYDIQSSVIYIGTAQAAALASQPKWTIKKINLDGGGNPTSQQFTKLYSAIWDNRTTETYF